MQSAAEVAGILPYVNYRGPQRTPARWGKEESLREVKAYLLDMPTEYSVRRRQQSYAEFYAIDVKGFYGILVLIKTHKGTVKTAPRSTYLIIAFERIIVNAFCKHFLCLLYFISKADSRSYPAVFVELNDIVHKIPVKFIGGHRIGDFIS